MKRATFMRMTTASIIVSAACGEYPVVNPHDSRYPQEVAIDGPTSVSSIGEIVTFTVRTNPAWTGSDPVWENSSKTLLTALGDGKYRVRYAELTPGVDTVRVSVGPHEATHAVVVRQKVASLRFVGVADTIHFVALGQEQSHIVEAADTGGTRVNLVGAGTITVVRDTMIARVEGSSVRAVANGSTWLVASVDGQADSVVVRVRQVPTTIRCANPAFLYNLPLQDSVQLVVARWEDALRNELAEEPVIVAWLFEPAYVYAPGVSMEVTSGGIVHTNEHPNGGTVSVRWRFGDSAVERTASQCSLRSVW